jgi:hypothetical protein
MLRLALVVVLSLSSLSFSQTSVRGALRNLQGMSDRLVQYADSLEAKGIEPTNQGLRGKIFAMFDSLLTGEALTFFKAKVDSGLSVGWQLANTDDFDWAFPVRFENCGRFNCYLLSESNNETAILCNKNEEECGDMVEDLRSNVCLSSPAADLAPYRIIYLVRTPLGWRINKISEPREMVLLE